MKITDLEQVHVDRSTLRHCWDTRNSENVWRTSQRPTADTYHKPGGLRARNMKVVSPVCLVAMLRLMLHLN